MILDDLENWNSYLEGRAAAKQEARDEVKEEYFNAGYNSVKGDGVDVDIDEIDDFNAEALAEQVSDDNDVDDAWTDEELSEIEAEYDSPPDPDCIFPDIDDGVPF